ncbi:MAG: MFS transporter [Acidimicrobiales bacterium]
MSGARTATDDSDRLVRTLAGTTFLLWLGAGAILPLLPEYVRRRGASDAVVGLVMAAYFVAALASQYPAGRFADRVGRRRVLLGGLGCYALGSAAFLAPFGPVADIAFRSLQGVGAGAAEVAALAMVSTAVPLSRRGRSFGSIYAGQLGGLAIGPLAGSIAGLGAMHATFAGAALVALAAGVPIVATAGVGRYGAPPRRAEAASSGVVARRPKDVAGDAAWWPERTTTTRGASTSVSRGHARATGRRSIPPAALGALVAAAAFGLTMGVYESCWTLLLLRRHATSWQIGLSWTLFALPFAAMSRTGGWLADHADRRWLVVGSLTSSIGFCSLYPFVHPVIVLLALGPVEALGAAIALPSAQSLLTQGARPAALGAVEGLFSTSQTGAVAVAAALGGMLFGVATWAPFVATAGGAVLATASLPVVWRRVAGRVPDAALGGATKQTTGLAEPVS